MSNTGVTVGKDLNAYGNKNAATLLANLRYVGGDMNIAETGLTRFPSEIIEHIGGNVFVSRDAPAELLADLERLKDSGILKGDVRIFIPVFGLTFALPEERFSTGTISSLLCFHEPEELNIFESEEELSLPEKHTITRVLETEEMSLDDPRGLVDLLGAYFAEEAKIELYIEKIAFCAQALKCNFLDLYRTVKVHELCHAIQHLGRDQSGASMDIASFSKIPSEILEPLAQYWTRIVCARVGAGRALEAFGRLDRHHPSIYRRWSELERHHPETVRSNWIRIRQNKNGAPRFSDLVKR